MVNLFAEAVSEEAVRIEAELGVEVWVAMRVSSEEATGTAMLGVFYQRDVAIDSIRGYAVKNSYSAPPEAIDGWTVIRGRNESYYFDTKKDGKVSRFWITKQPVNHIAKWKPK